MTDEQVEAVAKAIAREACGKEVDVGEYERDLARAAIAAYEASRPPVPDEQVGAVAKAVSDALNLKLTPKGRDTVGRAAIAAYEASQWQPIETAPRDGTWIVTVDFSGEYEVGRYDPFEHKTFVPAGDGLFRQETYMVSEWRGLDNFNRAKYWLPLPMPPGRS